MSLFLSLSKGEFKISIFLVNTAKLLFWVYVMDLSIDFSLSKGERAIFFLEPKPLNLNLEFGPGIWTCLLSSESIFFIDEINHGSL